MSKKFFHQKILLNFIAGCALTLIPAPNIFAGDTVTENSASSSQTSQTLPIQSAHNNSDVPVLDEQILDFPEKYFLPKNQCLKIEGLYCQKAVRKICEKWGTTWEKQNIYRIAKPVLAAMGEKPLNRAERRCVSLFYNRAARYDDTFINLFSMCCWRITLAEAMGRPVPTSAELTKELIEMLSRPNS